MKRKSVYSAVAGALLLSGAGMASAGQQLVCDREPTAAMSANCYYRDVPERVVAPSGTHYVVPAERERVILSEPIERERRAVVREPIERERVVVREPVTATAVEPVIVSRGEAENPYPFPSPSMGEVKERVFVPVEPQIVESTPGLPRGVPTD